MKKAKIGFIGLAVMGENIVLNIESKGFSVAVFNRTQATTDSFLLKRANNKHIIGTKSLKELVEKIEKPRKIILMIKAGKPVDLVLNDLLPLLESGDIIVDGGNSNYEDTTRRVKQCQKKGIYFVGAGISGGEEGALNGPSIMPGGNKKAWKELEPIFTAISAKAKDGSPCTSWIGPEGSGHFVKMVHNGIEYGDMQVLAEAYWIMKNLLEMDSDSMAKTFETWNKGSLNSYLVEITANILKHKDIDGLPLLEKILDSAGQKGTGKWTSIFALNEGVPLTLITESVFARFVSSQKDSRINASQIFASNKGIVNSLENEGKAPKANSTTISIEDLHDAIYASKIVSYAQGFELIARASKAKDWGLNLSNIAKIWRAGCIIRSAFLDDISNAFYKNPNLESLILDEFFIKELKKAALGWRKTVSFAVLSGVPVPALSSALAWFDSYTSKNLPANLIQAQRDYFGAHSYEKKDNPRGEFFHTDWTGMGGSTTSGSYNA